MLNSDKNKYPLISIITVVFNSKNLIEITIQSVLEQDYPNIEYILIDGVSNDGTIEKIKKYHNQITHFISEPDKGIYDAMNKGIFFANGDWINFLNAGDRFLSKHTISELVSNIKKTSDIVYGSVGIIYPNFCRIENPGNLKNLWRGMQFSHQSAFVKLRHYKENLFNLNNKIAADLGFFYKAYKKGLTFQRINQNIAVVITGGISESNRIATILDSCNAVCSGRFCLSFRFYYGFRILDEITRLTIKNILPINVIMKIILMKK